MFMREVQEPEPEPYYPEFEPMPTQSAPIPPMAYYEGEEGPRHPAVAAMQYGVAQPGYPQYNATGRPPSGYTQRQSIFSESEYGQQSSSYGHQH